ncbi:MAG: imidazole glycerol phosphate synthase subunit HisF [Cyanobacteria bacterium K_DeepCast_35m_m2_023]|nr:imidazole glycerol phosphate synthase subunit HisF [Cyanobacteria bacterium K_DeepCast_35m_m2_023]
MLKRRLIPKLQLALQTSFRGPRPVLVVTRQFGSRRPIGDPLSQAKIYEAQLADELVLVDLERTQQSWSVLLETVTTMAATLATPLAVGGGIRNFDQVQQLLDRGADKVVLNSGALASPGLIDQVASAYGAQCVVLSVDVRPGGDQGWQVFAEAGQQAAALGPVRWAQEAVARGVGELLVTAIARDGTGEGLDLELVRAMRGAVSVPVIASGGCGRAEHFVAGYQAGAAAVAAGTFFSQRDQNPMQCRSHIRNAGLPIRLEQ